MAKMGRPRKNTTQASMRIDEHVWKELLPKMGEINGETRTECIERLIREEAVRIGIRGFGVDP